MRTLRWLGWLVGGVAAMALAGYLVAALVLFPAPLLPNERAVARVTGLSEEDAVRDVEHQGLVPAVTSRETHSRVPAGVVIWQDPPAGVAVPRGDSVRLTVSLGPPKVAVPDVRGYDPDMAQRLVVAAGLVVERMDTVAMKPPGAPTGTVGGSTPAAGDSVRAGRGVTLHLVQ